MHADGQSQKHSGRCRAIACICAGKLKLCLRNAACPPLLRRSNGLVAVGMLRYS